MTPRTPPLCGRCTSNLVRRGRAAQGGLMARGKTAAPRRPASAGTAGASLWGWLGWALVVLLADQFTKR